jgi:hypothetical protein
VTFAVCMVFLTFCSTSLHAELPYGALHVDQSAYALGSFALNVIFVESDGSIDANQEDWTAEQLTTMHTEIEAAATFWEGLTSAYHPNAQLDVTVNYVNSGVPLATGYEAITRDGWNGSSLWMNDVLATMGYNGTIAKINTRDFNNDQRAALGTHWAATLYVVNDAVDSDGKFADGRFAFSLHGGPYVVTTYSNNGWGVNRYHKVLAHELGHVFFALDEYKESFERNNERSGYLGGVNGNAELDASGQETTPPEPDALMLNITLDPSSFTSVQIGHLDTDGDSIPDILDTLPRILGQELGSDPDAGIFGFMGLASVQPMNNVNPKVWADSGSDITINTLESGQYNLDGQGWIEFLPVDGSFGDYEETLQLQLTDLAPGPHTIDIRITNSVGNHSALQSFEILVTPEPATLGVLWAGMIVCLRRGRKRRKAAGSAT